MSKLLENQNADERLSGTAEWAAILREARGLRHAWAEQENPHEA